MSRTLKDAPYTIRARRHGRGITSHLPNCDRTSVFGERFTAVFYAHEVREFEAFHDRAEALGYEVTSREREGFLAERARVDMVRIERSTLVRCNAEFLTYGARTVSDRPAPSRFRMLAFRDGSLKIANDHRPKRNIFVVVEAEKLHYSEGTCWHGEYDLEPGFRHSGRMRSRNYRRSRRG